MAADLKYYEEERYRHQEAIVMAKPETVQECCNFLFRCFKVAPIPVYNRKDNPPPGKQPTNDGDSFFQSGLNPFIALTDGVCLLTICHEVAHYIHYLEVMAARAAGDTKRVKWHGPRHRKLVDQMVPMLRMAYPHIRRECGVPM